MFGAANPGEPFSVYQRSKTIFKEGGFNLRKFISNNLGQQARIDEAECNFTSVSSQVENERETYVKTMLKGSQEEA